MADFMARRRGQHHEARQCGQHQRPGSVANFMARQCGHIVRPGSMADIRGPTAWSTSRPASCMADFKARKLRGRCATRSGRG